MPWLLQRHPKTVSRGIVEKQSLISLLSLVSSQFPYVCLLLSCSDVPAILPRPRSLGPVVRIVSESTTSASNEHVFTPGSLRDPKKLGVLFQPCTLHQSLNDPKSFEKHNPKKLPKNKHKGTSSAASNSCSCLNLSLVKGAGFWGGKSGFESEILSAAPPKFVWNLRRKRFFDHPHPPETKNHPLKRGGHNFFHDSPQHFRHSICSFIDKALHHLGHSHFEVFLRHMLTSLAQGEHSGLGTQVWGNPQGVLDSVHDKIMACASSEHDREWYRYRMVWGSIWGVWKKFVIMIYSHTYVHLKSPTANKFVSAMCNAWHFTTTTPSKRLSTNCLTLCTTRAVHTRGDLLQINATPLFSMEEAPKELQDSILEDLQKGSLFQFHLFVIMEDCQSWCWYQLPEIWNLVYAYII